MPPKIIQPPVIDPVLRVHCPICKSPHKQQIHTLRASGMDYGQISEEMRKAGHGCKRETLGKHFRLCLGGVKPLLDDTTAIAVADAATNAQGQAEIDFAMLVQRRATEMLRDGQLRVTASHGLQAQALLDRRAEKSADRDLAINIARLLSGSISMPPMEVIEGRYTEMLELNSGLAPMDLVEA
jgi:hypothetical protein